MFFTFSNPGLSPLWKKAYRALHLQAGPFKARLGGFRQKDPHLTCGYALISRGAKKLSDPARNGTLMSMTRVWRSSPGFVSIFIGLSIYIYIYKCIYIYIYENMCVSTMTTARKPQNDTQFRFWMPLAQLPVSSHVKRNTRFGQPAPPSVQGINTIGIQDRGARIKCVKASKILGRKRRKHSV